MLVSKVIDRVCLQLAEDTSNPNYLSRAQLLVLFNDCVQELVESLHCFTKMGFVHCEMNKPKYTLASDLEQLLWMTYDGKPLNPRTIRDWAGEDTSWQTKRGTPLEHALDLEKDHVVWLNPCPSSDGDEFIPDSSSGVPYAIVDPWRVAFDAQTQDFTVGKTLTGAVSLATGTILYVDQDGYSGTIYFESDPGDFLDNELITDTDGGSATANGTTQDSGGTTWIFSRSYGLVESIKAIDGSDFWDLVDENGEEMTSGVISEIWSPKGNLIYKYSYYPKELGETDSLLRPFGESDGLYVDFMMFQTLMVEAEGQDLARAAWYAQQFERKTGIRLTQAKTPQREFSQREYSPGTTGRKTVSYPDNWPAVDKGY
jgi:hypothetical protein